MKRKATRPKGRQSAKSGDKKSHKPANAKRRGAKKVADAGPAKSPRSSKPRSGRPARKTKPPARKSSPPSAETSRVPGTPQRLQKVLAAAGHGSRRQCEELILTGRVEVDREVVTHLGTRVDPQKQKIRVDGVELRQPKTVWYALNKPMGVVCTNRDPGGRPRAVDLIPELQERLFPVGRLDMNSEGLLLLTNDGELANQLAHPRYEIKKVYRVLVAGQATRETLVQLQRGVYLSEGLTRIAGVTIKRRYKKSTILEMVLQEGKNREIRRVLARVGHKVMRLVRVATGPIKLGDLEPGDSRRLTRKEIEALRRHVQSGTSGSNRPRR